MKFDTKAGKDKQKAYDIQKACSEIRNSMQETHATVSGQKERRNVHADFKNSISLETVMAIKAYIRNELSEDTFASFVLSEMQKKGIKPAKLCKAVGMDRRMFSKLKTQPNYRPSKNTALLYCFALRLNEEEMEYLLSLAGYSLAPYSQRAAALRYCIAHGIYDVDDVNELLYGLGEMALSRL